jgi:hypothetical protein
MKHRDRAVRKETSKESLYRTMWLMAHNRLHTLTHDSSVEWKQYLRELRLAKTVAKTSA